MTLTANVPNGRPRVQLEWTGASGSSVDVIRNGATIDTTTNDGSYQDRNVTSGVEYTYQVCEEGSSICSNTVTVTP